MTDKENVPENQILNFDEKINSLAGKIYSQQFESSFKESNFKILSGLSKYTPEDLLKNLFKINDYNDFLGNLDFFSSTKASHTQTSYESYYSPELLTPGSYFESTEKSVSSFSELIQAIEKISNISHNIPIVWRGQQNSDWGVHSSLFRVLLTKNNVSLPQGKVVTESQVFPSEDDMVAAEKKIIDFARREWRFDDMPALELLAMLQHYGTPTRLLDASRNPLIAAWFAVQDSTGTKEKDARIIAFATEPYIEGGVQGYMPAHGFSLSNMYPFWHEWDTMENRVNNQWGTGANRRIWVPKIYNQRISAQNAVFVLDGTPITSQKTAPYFTKSRNKYWRRADLLASSSIYMKVYSLDRKVRENGPKFAPTFTLKISSEAKSEIRKKLESVFSYRYSTIYPDISGLSNYINENMHEII